MHELYAHDGRVYNRPSGAGGRDVIKTGLAVVMFYKNKIKYMDFKPLILLLSFCSLDIS
jgi:hypothetical protein